MRRFSVAFAAVFVFVFGLAVPARAVAVVPCNTPSDSCTGDPCTTGALTVAPTCDLDFGAAALVIKQPLVVPDGGTLVLRAASITVAGPITGIGARGPSITLIATGDIKQQGSIRTIGNASPGAITLQAGGNITLAGNVGAPAGIASGSVAGSVTLSTNGNVGCPIGCRMDVRGQGTTASGHLSVTSGGDMYFPVGTHLDGGGGTGGTFTFDAGGNFYSAIDNRIKANGAGATYRVTAGGSITEPRDIMVDGGTHGGSLQLVAGTTVTFSGLLRSTSSSGAGGTIDVSGAKVQITAQPSVIGRAAGGRLHFVATGPDGLSVKASADARPGGTMQFDAPAGPVVLTGRYRVGTGGCIGVTGAIVNLSAATLDTVAIASCP